MKNYLIIEFNDSNRIERVLVDKSVSNHTEILLSSIRRSHISKKITKVNLRDFIIVSLMCNS